MATTESPTVLERIFDLAPGDPVTLGCQTTDAPIYYKGPAEYGRVPFTPEESHLRPTGYDVEGKFLGIEHPLTEGGITFVITSRIDGHRPVIQRTPILAITKISFH